MRASLLIFWVEVAILYFVGLKAACGPIVVYFAHRGSIIPAERDRFNVSCQEPDKYVFNIPSLRDVNNTFPYSTKSC